jgi:hypothetical protein
VPGHSPRRPTGNRTPMWGRRGKSYPILTLPPCWVIELDWLVCWRMPTRTIVDPGGGPDWDPGVGAVLLVAPPATARSSASVSSTGSISLVGPISRHSRLSGSL